MILKLKKINFTTIRCRHRYVEDVDIEEVLVSNKISSGGKSYKYFVGYLYNNHKVKPLHKMLSKTSACKIL